MSTCRISAVRRRSPIGRRCRTRSIRRPVRSFSQPGVYAQRIDDKVAVAGVNNIPVQNVGNIVCANDPASTSCTVSDQDGNPLPASVTFTNQVSAGAVTIDPVAYVVSLIRRAMTTLPGTRRRLRRRRRQLRRCERYFRQSGECVELRRHPRARSARARSISTSRRRVRCLSPAPQRAQPRSRRTVCRRRNRSRSPCNNSPSRTSP